MNDLNFASRTGRLVLHRTLTKLANRPMRMYWYQYMGISLNSHPFVGYFLLGVCSSRKKNERVQRMLCICDLISGNFIATSSATNYTVVWVDSLDWKGIMKAAAWVTLLYFCIPLLFSAQIINCSNMAMQTIFIGHNYEICSPLVRSWCLYPFGTLLRITI